MHENRAPDFLPPHTPSLYSSACNQTREKSFHAIQSFHSARLELRSLVVVLVNLALGLRVCSLTHMLIILDFLLECKANHCML